MNDLISRSALIAYMCGHCGANCNLEDECCSNVEAVENAPAVDAVEVGNCDGCYWKEIGRQQKCSCCRRNRDMKDCYKASDNEGQYLVRSEMLGQFLHGKSIAELFETED